MHFGLATFGAIVRESVDQESRQRARGGSSSMVLRNTASKLRYENRPEYDQRSDNAEMNRRKHGMPQARCPIDPNVNSLIR